MEGPRIDHRPTGNLKQRRSQGLPLRREQRNWERIEALNGRKRKKRHALLWVIQSGKNIKGKTTTSEGGGRKAI